LIYLGVQPPEALAREQATKLAAGFVGKIEPQIQVLAGLALKQAKLGAEQSAGADSLPVAAGAFWLGANGEVVAVRPADATLAAAISSEWAALPSEFTVARPAVLGPIRQGSDWLVAARVPVMRRGASGQPPEWAVAYANLDALIAPAHLGRLVTMGYDFELAQVEPRSARSRSFVTSDTQRVSDAVAVTIHLPANFAAAIPGSYLQLSVRPHDGWYAPTQLASEIGLLVFLAWMFAFGVHDLSHALQRAQSKL